MAPLELSIPYNFTPRSYQQPIFNYMDYDFEGKRAVLVWHRRAGKDKSLLNIVAREMFKRVGGYYYFFPTYKQGRMALWEAIDKSGFKVMNHIPMEMRNRTNDTTMFIETVNRSTFQIIGTENYDRIVGTNPVGCVFSEYSLQDPSVWAYMSPILAENGGWAIFNFTPRGKNHGWDILQLAQEAGWFWQVLTVDDTKAISEIALEQEKLMKYRTTGSDAMFLQEYYCDFTVALPGAYYQDQIADATREGRVRRFAWERQLPVHTAWDIGVGDSTAIWFFQMVGNEVRVIDFLKDNGKTIGFYIKELQKKPYTYGEHFGPHDLNVKDFSGPDMTRKDAAQSLGVTFRILPKLSLEDGISAARNIFPRCWFNVPMVDKGLDALKAYRKAYDDKKNMYLDYPEHDWSSHPADAFRYMAIAVNLISGDFEERDQYTHVSEDVPEDSIYD